jgi:hypothetical protein
VKITIQTSGANCLFAGFGKRKRKVPEHDTIWNQAEYQDLKLQMMRHQLCEQQERIQLIRAQTIESEKHSKLMDQQVEESKARTALYQKATLSHDSEAVLKLSSETVPILWNY